MNNSLCTSLNKSQLQAPAIQNVHNFLWRGFRPLKKGSLIKAHENRLFVNVLTVCPRSLILPEGDGGIVYIV